MLAETRALTRQLAALVTGRADALMAIYGAGPVVAAGSWPRSSTSPATRPGRVRLSQRHRAAGRVLGRTVRHRLNPGGNRQLNTALYTIAITQIRTTTEGRAYYDRKRAEGKTSREAIRCLKRRLSDQVYKAMRTDAATTPSPRRPTIPRPPEAAGTAGATRRV